MKKTIPSTLRTVLGERWYIILLALLFILLLPIGVFYNKISFAPDRFTEEWIKTITSGFVFYIILKIFDTSITRRAMVQDRIGIKNKLRNHLLNIQSLFRQETNLNDSELRKNYYTIISIKNIYFDKVFHSPEIMEFYGSDDFNFLTNTFEDLSRLNLTDFQEINVRIDKLLTILKD